MEKDEKPQYSRDHFRIFWRDMEERTRLFWKFHGQYLEELELINEATPDLNQKKILRLRKKYTRLCHDQCIDIFFRSQEQGGEWSDGPHMRTLAPQGGGGGGDQTTQSSASHVKPLLGLLKELFR